MNSKQKNLIVIFLSIYLIAFFAFNWNDASWVFNYREVSGLIYDFFNPYQTVEAFPAAQIQTTANEVSTSNTAVVKPNYTYTDKEDGIEIPDIGISSPIMFPVATDASTLAAALDKGVVYYPGSVLPGQKGEIVIIGHSAPVGWPKIKHDWVFSDLEKLNAGSKIYIYLDNKEYIYTVQKTDIIKKGQEIAPTGLTNSDGMLVLVSCWPPGKNLQRIAVQAQLLSN